MNSNLSQTSFLEMQLTRDLHAILKQDDDAKLKEYCELENKHNQQITITFPSGHVPLILKDKPPLISVASYFGALKCIDFLLTTNTKVTVTDSQGRSPAHFAAAKDNVAVLNKLRSLRVCFPDNQGCSVAHYAALFNAVNVLQWCVENKVPLDVPSKFGCPIHYACKSKSMKAIEFFANLNIEAMKKCCSTNENYSKYDINTNNSPNENDSKFKNNINDGTDDNVNINVTNNNNNKNKVSSNNNNSSGSKYENANESSGENLPIDMNRLVAKFSPLNLLLDNKCYEAIPILIKAGLNIDAPLYNGWPILYYAIRGNFEQVERLVKLGCDVRGVAAQGWTAMHVAAQERNMEAVELLLKNGADPHILTANGCSPFSLAAGFSTKDKKAATAARIKEAVAEEIAKAIISKKINSM